MSRKRKSTIVGVYQDTPQAKHFRSDKEEIDVSDNEDEVARLPSNNTQLTQPININHFSNHSNTNTSINNQDSATSNDVETSINKLMENQKQHSLLFEAEISKKINISHLSLFGSNINCVCSMYAIDYINKNNKDFQSIKFRISPFDIKYKHTYKHNDDVEPKDLVQYDDVIDFNGNDAQITYFHLGSDVADIEELYFRTECKWTAKYTFIFWIKWERNMTLITTFDSSSNAPIYVRNNRIGCAFEGTENNWYNNWLTLKDYIINPDDDKWSFVVAQGGDNNTNIYVGDLNTIPEYVGSVECDIANKTTCRIGNVGQGPGKVASILIFDAHLNMDAMKNVYYQSRNEIFVHLTDKQQNIVRELLLSCLKLPELVQVIFDYIRYCDF